MKKISIISALALSALVYSCDKDNDSKAEEPAKKPADLIVGRWAWVSAKDLVTKWSGTPEDTIRYSYGAKDSLFFESNGRVITSILSKNYVDTSSYRFINDSTFIWWNDTAKVSEITENKLQITQKDTVYGNLGGIRQSWLNFKR